MKLQQTPVFKSPLVKLCSSSLCLNYNSGSGYCHSKEISVQNNHTFCLKELLRKTRLSNKIWASSLLPLQSYTRMKSFGSKDCYVFWSHWWVQPMGNPDSVAFQGQSLSSIWAFTRTQPGVSSTVQASLHHSRRGKEQPNTYVHPHQLSSLQSWCGWWEPLSTNHRLPVILNLQAGGPWLCRFNCITVTSINICAGEDDEFPQTAQITGLNVNMGKSKHFSAGKTDG